MQRLEELACIKAAGSYDDRNLVFPMAWGGIWDPRAFSLTFRRLAKDALGEVRGNIGPHTLRHTTATLMFQQGLDPRAVADRLGHSTTRMTLDVYAHVAREVNERAATPWPAQYNPLPIRYHFRLKRRQQKKQKQRNRLRRKAFRWWAREVSNL